MDSSFPRLHFRGYIQSRLNVTLLCLLVVFSAAAPLRARPATELHTTTTTATTSWGRTHIGLPSTLPQATTGVPYSTVLTPTGGASPYSFSLTGLLPAGLSLNSATGAISGTPTVAGTFYFRVDVSDQQGDHGDKRLSILVRSGGTPITLQLSPTTASLSSGGNQQFSATVTGTSNTAVTWYASAGSISSTGSFTAPIVQTTSAVTVTASSQASLEARASATVNIAPGTPSVTVMVNPGATSLVTGGSLQFTATVSGTSNPGVTWSAVLGTISQSGLYAAPSSTGTDTIRAVSQADSTKYATAVVSIVSPQPSPVNPGSSGADNRYCAVGNTVTGLSQDGPALPMQRCFNTDTANTPSPGTVLGPVTTLSGLNAAYATASCGDIIQITAGSSITGPWSPAGKGCDNAHYITVESTGVTNASFPTEGTRTTPCWSNVPSLPNRPAYTCPSPTTLTAQFVAPSSSSAMLLSGTDHIRFIGIEFTRLTTPHLFYYNIVDLSTSGGTQTNHIIFDRCWIHGVNADGTFPQTSSTDTSTTRGVYLGQANNVAVIDSYLSDFYDNGSVATNGNTDAQAIAGGFGSATNSGWGVYKFVNNHMEGASEGILLGGSNGPALTPAGCTQGVNCNLDVPTNVEIRRNYFFAPNSWNGNTTTINSTGWPNRKNGIEFKTGANILLEANVFENCWYSSQPYCYVFDFAPKNQMNFQADPGTCPSCLVQDAISRYNYGYNYPGIQIALYTTSYVGGCAGCGQTLGRRISIHDNLVGDLVNVGNLTGLTGFDCVEFFATAGPITNISFQHNTCAGAVRSMMLFGGQQAGWLDNITFQNNLMAAGTYNIANGGGCGQTANTFFALLNNCINGTTVTWTVDHNAEFNWNSGTLGAGWPTNGSGLGNFFYTNSAGPGFTNYNSGNSNFAPQNYILTSGSPLHNAGSDGKDLGADIPTLITKISGVRQ